ncbi:MAG: SDR family oxidoreductase [Acidimicrobiia bacterium]|nr:SDR family oxidoreductase [Acidimicrobiia bacterium]
MGESSFSGQRVLITDASSGIGAGLAERFAREGAIVGICARREDRLREVLDRCRAHSPESRMWVCDLAVADEVDRLAEAAVAEMGGVDVLVNNAGVPKRRDVSLLDPETVDALTTINYLSPVRLTLRLLSHMLERDSGKIVNVSSVAAVLSSPGEAAYDASKAALSVFSEGMAVDLWDTGVNVLTVYPGVVDTELFDIPGNDPLSPEIERISVTELVDGVMDALGRGVIEVYIPEWFKGVAARKANDVELFLAGTAGWVRGQKTVGGADGQA